MSGRRRGARQTRGGRPQQKWGPALLPAPTAPSEGSAGVRNLILKPESSKIRSRSWLTSSGVASYLIALSCEKPDRSTDQQPGGSSIFQSARPAFSNRSSPSQNNRMFHGPSWGNHSCVPLCLSRSEDPSKPRRARGDHLFRRLYPAGPASAPERTSTLPAGGDRTFGHLPHLLAVADRLVRLGPPSRSHRDHALRLRVGEAKNSGRTLWITGISGTTVGTFQVGGP